MSTADFLRLIAGGILALVSSYIGLLIKNGYKETGLFLSYLGVDYEVFCMSEDFDPKEFKEMMKEIRVEGFEPKYFCK